LNEIEKRETISNIIKFIKEICSCLQSIFGVDFCNIGTTGDLNKSRFLSEIQAAYAREVKEFLKRTKILFGDDIATKVLEAVFPNNIKKHDKILLFICLGILNKRRKKTISTKSPGGGIIVDGFLFLDSSQFGNYYKIELDDILLALYGINSDDLIRMLIQNQVINQDEITTLDNAQTKRNKNKIEGNNILQNLHLIKMFFIKLFTSKMKTFNTTIISNCSIRFGNIFFFLKKLKNLINYSFG
jgi:hypothetical protein